MKITTPLTDLLGIDIPIIQAPIGGASTPELAAAVTNAGGLGMLSVTWTSPDALRDKLRRTRELTDGPFGVNLVLDWDPSERLRIALDEGVPVISFFWGDPSPYIKQIHDAGALVTLTIGSAEEAKRAVDIGVDIVIAQGWEAGGHVWGKVATLPLIPAVVDAVPGTPVVAAGGVVDGRGLAAALALGASGAWMGTRFVLAEESAAHELYQQMLIAAAETGAHYSELFDGGWSNAPLRALRNSTIEAWEAAGSPPVGARPGEGELIGHNALGDPVERYSSDGPLQGATGEIEAMVLYSGQGVGILHDVRPAGEIVTSVAQDAMAALDRTRASFMP
jgi:NAD(P)H-dependent flavin oxidoreductase YrpB (nitropropane dioxygenase family)